MSKLIIANWKMNPDSLAEALALAKACDKNGVVLAPPFPFILPVARALKQAELGAQDCATKEQGAFTGEVSVLQLKDCGVKYVIVGHSERRQLFQENDIIIGEKLRACLGADLIPVLCLGETLKQRKGKKAKQVVRAQLNGALKVLTENYQLKLFYVVYEPAWAIGTGLAETPQGASEMISYIYSLLKNAYKISNPRVLYGGSVSRDNARAFLNQKEVNGLLVGGASLKVEDFLRIISD
jgi:triosephosphate isomerase